MPPPRTPATTSPHPRGWRSLLPRSITWRVLIGLTLVTTTTLAAATVAAISQTRAALMAVERAEVAQVVGRIGRAPDAVGHRPPRPPDVGPPPGPVGAPAPGTGVGTAPAAGPGPTEATLVIDGSGTVVSARPTGPADDPDPLPDAGLVAALVHVPGDVPTTAVVPSEDGSLRYLVAVLSRPGGGVVVAARPLDGVDAAIARQRTVLTLGAVAALLVLLGGATVVVRRGLAPVERIAATATRVGDGERDARSEVVGQDEVGRLGAVFDRMLDELERETRARERSQRRLTSFVADASHELRTPLTAVAGWAELYEAGALEDPERLDTALTAVRENARRMDRLVEDMLTLAKLDDERPMASTLVDVAALATAAVEDVRAIDSTRRYVLDAGPDAVLAGDPDRLRQVVDNLLSNTRSHTPAGTEVRVVVRRVADTVVVSVVDDGPGIPADTVSRLFDRFFRAAPARALDRNGSGLGLAIVQAITTAHGGQVDVASEVGEGATFTVRLPTAQPAATPGVLASSGVTG